MFFKGGLRDGGSGKGFAAVYAAAATLQQLWCICSAATCYDNDGFAAFVKADFPHCMQPHPSVLVYYGVSGDFLRLGMQVDAHSGWSSLALGGNGGMKGAHQIVVRQDSGGTWVAEDRHSEEYATPLMDVQQDAKLLFAEESGSRVSWAVLLPLESCDEDDYQIENASRWMHWAYGDGHNFVYHGKKRGQFHANLIHGPEPQLDVSGFEEFDLHVPDVELPANASSGVDPTNPYICAVFNLADLMPSRDLSRKHHIVKMAPYLNPASAQYVHHMILYGCEESAVSDNNFKHGQVTTDCVRMPSGCQSMIWPWAVGSLDIIFPENVGMPIGESTKWVALQMHYYNPRVDAGVVDTSGVRLMLADRLRVEDAAVFMLNGGVTSRSRPPLEPGRSSITLPSFIIPGVCTQSWELPSVSILGIVHHQHLAGKHVQVDVIRNGTFVGTMRREKHYDFQHQSLETSSVKRLYRGDSLNMTCTYDTSQRTAQTTFGDFSNQEMCFAAFLYYPAQAFTLASFSEPDPQRELQEYKAYCLQPGPSEAVSGVEDFTGVSNCAYFFVHRVTEMLGWGSMPIQSQVFCNTGIPGSVTPAQIMSFMPGTCPPCWKHSNCTSDDMLAWGQASYCVNMCDDAGLSLWPDTSRAEVTAHTHQTRCQGSDRGVVSFTPPYVREPECQQQGDLSSAAAAAASHLGNDLASASSRMAAPLLVALVPVAAIAVVAAVV